MQYLLYFAIFIVVCILVFKVLPFLFLLVVGLGILGFGTIGYYKLKTKKENRPY